jgi:hypothetical protein
MPYLSNGNPSLFLHTLRILYFLAEKFFADFLTTVKSIFNFSYLIGKSFLDSFNPCYFIVPYRESSADLLMLQSEMHP